MFIDFIQKDEYKIGLWKITETEAELFAILPEIDKESPRVLAARVPQKRKERLAARACFRRLTGFGNDVPLLHEEKGAPYLIMPNGLRLLVSLAHSEDLAVVMISSKYRVGIDVETYPLNRNLETSRIFMNESEIALFLQDERYFLRFWTAKECVYKLLRPSDGLSFKRGIAVSAFNPETQTATAYVPEQGLRFTIFYAEVENALLAWTYAPFEEIPN